MGATVPTETTEPRARRADQIEGCLDRLERVICEMATAVAGVSQAGRWVFNEHFERDADGRVTLR